MGILDIFRQQAYQRKPNVEERTKNVRQTIVQLASEGEGIEGILVIFLKNGKVYVMEGGLQDDFEAQVLIQRAIYLINRDGLITT